jgi:hypothetical protein
MRFTRPLGGQVPALLIIAVVILPAAPAEAITYNCFTVENQAIVYANEPVTLFEDKPNKICKFSVAGATSALPPIEIRQRLLVAMPFMRFAQQPDVTVIAEAVPHLLAAAGPTADGTVPRALDQLVKANAATLLVCLDAFFFRRSRLEPITRQKNFGCGLRGPEGVEANILEIYARFETYLNTLFLNRPPLR